MKWLTYVGGVVAVGFLLVFVSTWLTWRIELRRLYSPQSIIEETGLLLPKNARVTATQARLFSLADSTNYKWLIQSNTTLLPWATSTMRVENGGREHIQEMAELEFSDEIPSNAKFGGVWRAVQTSSRGQQETSYLFLSNDGRVAILETLRP